VGPVLAHKIDASFITATPQSEKTWGGQCSTLNARSCAALPSTKNVAVPDSEGTIPRRSSNKPDDKLNQGLSTKSTRATFRTSALVLFCLRAHSKTNAGEMSQVIAILWLSSCRSAHDEFALRAKSALPCTWTSAHLAGRDTEASSKGPIERGETIETPGIGDVGN